LSVALAAEWLARRVGGGGRALLSGCLDLGFDALIPETLGGAQFLNLVPELEDFPVKIPAVRVSPEVEGVGLGLCGKDEESFLATQAEVQKAAQLGTKLGTPLILLEAPLVDLGAGSLEKGEIGGEGSLIASEDYQSLRSRLLKRRDSLLDRCCRRLHSLARSFPEHRFGLLEAGNFASLSGLEDLELIFSDLKGSVDLGYWHRPSVVRFREELGGAQGGDVLETLSKYLIGTDLSDFDGEGIFGLPGSGGVDYGALRPYIRGSNFSLPAYLGPSFQVPPGEIKRVRGFLQKFGF